MDVKCKRCWSQSEETLNVNGECKSCEFKLNRAPRFLEWDFCYRVYTKQRAIQFKPLHDKANHFSIVWTKDRKGLTLEDLNKMDEIIKTYIRSNGNVLTFRIIRACKNCTYGRFEQEFEDIILDLRKKFLYAQTKTLHWMIQNMIF